MHKATFLEGTLRFTITPNGPILVKAGESGSVDPTLPDMRFVRSQSTIYIPGPSLKGVVRAQAERICRSLDSADMQKIRLQRRKALDDQEREALIQQQREEYSPPGDILSPLADNPLGKETHYDPKSMGFSSGRYIESLQGKEGQNNQFNKHPQRTAIVYRRSSFASQIFGHTSLAGRVRFADAAASSELAIEERNGVAIDRIYGSVAVGPFNYEVVVGGSFTSRIDFKNLTLAQLALLGLALRDVAEGRVGIGFGKSRGLGRVDIIFDEMSLRYPACIVAGNMLQLLNKRQVCKNTELAGLGAFCNHEDYNGYALPKAADDTAPLPQDLAYIAERPFGATPANDDEQDDQAFGVTLIAKGHEQVRSIWRACMPAWKREIGL